MKPTYIERRRRIQSGEYSIEDVLQDFPSLKLSEIILDEASQVFRKDVEGKFTENMRLLDNIRKLLMTKKMSTSASTNLFHADKYRSLLCIPALFRENEVHFLFSKDADVVTPYPAIYIAGVDEPPFIYLHGRELCKAEDIKQAVLLIYCCYWVFDIVIPKNLLKTIELVGYLATGTNVKNNTVQKALNHIL
ncbi:uncharacterized protein LOC144748383 isoform X2 [Ciona intestinalis]